MNLYSKEQIEELKKLDVIQHFQTALDSDYKRGTSSIQDNKVADIYDAATGGKVSRNFSCKSCVFNLYRKAGELYRETLEWMKKEKELKKKNKKVDNENNNESDKLDK